MASLKDRIIRAARLDVNLYEEVEADKGALSQAMVVVVRQALDYKTTLRAVGVCIIGWVIQALIFAVLFS
ncbi:MAG: hypothetical protein JRI71_07890 [Deltaproteobacteria bacterium]|nr:hypothetical protein [Deltaproteobacteria bacterium]MBW2077456.1 hypothetical protein [Deltaproteobacteria bacterium]